MDYTRDSPYTTTLRLGELGVLLNSKKQSETMRQVFPRTRQKLKNEKEVKAIYLIEFKVMITKMLT